MLHTPCNAVEISALVLRRNAGLVGRIQKLTDHWDAQFFAHASHTLQRSGEKRLGPETERWSGWEDPEAYRSLGCPFFNACFTHPATQRQREPLCFSFSDTLHAGTESYCGRASLTSMEDSAL
eukprot:scaffold165312_cov22-Tisochrysis_lutea.AAC.1